MRTLASCGDDDTNDQRADNDDGDDDDDDHDDVAHPASMLSGRVSSCCAHIVLINNL